MKTIESIAWIVFIVAGIVGMWSVLFGWEPPLRTVALAAFLALTLAAGGRYWISRREHIKPQS